MAEIQTQTTTPAVTVADPQEAPVALVLAEFEHPGALLEAAKKTHEAGYKKFDTYSPFPIHGMDRAQGMGPSLLGYLVFGGGLTGLLIALWMQWWMNGVDYPLNISGKPLFSIEPAFPIAFELTVLLSALTAVGGMLALNRLPRPHNPLFNSSNFERVTDDAFFLAIEAGDKKFSEAEATRFLEDLGAINVETVRDI